jgi:hypothetical protein
VLLPVRSANETDSSGGELGLSAPSAEQRSDETKFQIPWLDGRGYSKMKFCILVFSQRRDARNNFLCLSLGQLAKGRDQHSELTARQFFPGRNA